MRRDGNPGESRSDGIFGGSTGRAPILEPTLRRKIFVAFLLMAAIAGLLGYQGVQWIGESGRLIARTYDKPLMAISYARSALANFEALEATAARLALEDEPERLKALADRLDRVRSDLDGDLDVVDERSESARAQAAVASVRAAVARWERSYADLAAGAAAWRDLDRTAAQTREQLDILVNLAAGDGFIGRQRALSVVEDNRRLYLIATLAALGLAGVIALVLARMIVRPVKAASDAAARIARGELDTPIPVAGRDELGTLLASMETMRDSIRAMMANEVARRRDAQTRLLDAIESSREGIVVIDAAGDVVIANSRVTGFAPGVTDRLASGTRFEDIILLAVQKGIFARHCAGDVRERLFVDAMPSACELQLENGNWLRFCRSATRDGGMIAVISDITGLKEREAALRAAKERAEAGSRSKTEFLTNMSHELRTPLNAVIGFAEMISIEAFGPTVPKYKEYADDILGSGRHLLSVINDVLDVARNEAGKLQIDPVPLDVATLIGECGKMVYDQCARAELTFRIEAPTQPLAISADPVRARQILLNLIANAVKFTPKGGTVSVGAEAADPGYVRLAVSDTGIGMAPDEIVVALEAFGQVDSRLARRYEGTGLGLPLTKALVDLHGGKLTIRSRPGAGTTVEILMPAAAGDVSAAA